MTARYFCMFCGEGIIAPAYSSHLECKSCGNVMDLPPSMSNANLSAPDTPSCASSVSSRSNSVESRSSAEARSPPPGSTGLPDLSLESDSNSDDEMDEHMAAGATGPLKKRRRSSGKRRDPRAPKRAANAYMLFCKYQRPLLKLSNPDLPFAIIGQTLGDMWRNLPNEARKPFEDRAAHDRERYKFEMTAYTASTLRMGPPMNQLLTQSMNHSMNQSMNPMMNQEMLNMMGQEYQLQAAQNQWNNESMAGQWGNESSPGNASIKQQVPLMVQQAQERFLQMQQQAQQQPRQRFHPYEQSLNQSMNASVNQSFHQLNNQTFDYPENRSLKAEPIKPTNNQFVYGPIKRERRLSDRNESYQNSTNYSVNSATKSPVNLNDSSFNQSFNQSNSRQQFAFDNFSQFESQYRNQASQNEFSSGPASALTCSGSALASSGPSLSSGSTLSSVDYFNLDAPQLWESTFDEI